MTVIQNSLGDCSEVDIMQKLKVGFRRCTFKDGRLQPCEYHANRSASLIFTTVDKGGCKTAGLSENVFMSPLVKSPEIIRMLEELNAKVSLAGSWWMVKEQREWLHRHLVRVFQMKVGDRCRLLVSGVAGYAHFYSYLHIVFDAAKEAGFDIENLYIDVLDACITPILEIAEIERSIREKTSVFGGGPIEKKYDILGFGMEIPSGNRAFIKSMIPDIRKCSIRALHCDVTHIADYRKEMINNYDVITEHFLLSMIENEIKVINEIRRSYASMIRPDGHLMMAGGFNSRSFIDRILELHQQHGFVLADDDNVKVWDPYGLSESQLQAIINEKSVQQITLDNILLDFTYKGPIQNEDILDMI